jgi:hypothetical protein
MHFGCIHAYFYGQLRTHQNKTFSVKWWNLEIFTVSFGNLEASQLQQCEGLKTAGLNLKESYLHDVTYSFANCSAPNLTVFFRGRGGQNSPRRSIHPLALCREKYRTGILIPIQRFRYVSLSLSNTFQKIPSLKS